MVISTEAIADCPARSQIKSNAAPVVRLMSAPEKNVYVSLQYTSIYTLGVGMSETRLIVCLMDSKLMRSVRVLTIYFAAHSRLDPLGGKFHVGIASLCFIVCYNGCCGANF